MQKLKNWLLALGAGALAIAALYIKWLEKAARKAELKSLQEKEKELVDEAFKHGTRADASLKRARKLREQLRRDSEDV